MLSRKQLKGLRILLGFLLAPAILSLSLFASLHIVLAWLGANPDGPAKIVLGLLAMGTGLGVPYAAAFGFWFPYFMLLGQKRLNFRTVMIPTLIFAFPYSAIVYLSFSMMRPPHPFAEAVAVPQIPAVILSGLCFYLLSVWKIDRGSS